MLIESVKAEPAKQFVYYNVFYNYTSRKAENGQ